MNVEEGSPLSNLIWYWNYHEVGCKDEYYLILFGTPSDPS